MHCEIININGGSFFMDIFTQEFTSSRIMKHICIVLTIQCNVHYTKKQIHEFTILKNIEKKWQSTKLATTNKNDSKVCP